MHIYKAERSEGSQELAHKHKHKDAVSSAQLAKVSLGSLA